MCSQGKCCSSSFSNLIKLKVLGSGLLLTGPMESIEKWSSDLPCENIVKSLAEFALRIIKDFRNSASSYEKM